MTGFAVINPRSAREWPKIERALRNVYPGLTIAMTRQQGEATMLVRRALSEGHSEIVAIGGDGTINESINGFFSDEGAVAPDAVFAFVTTGKGGDFRRTFGVAQGYAAAIDRLKDASVRPIDVGYISCVSRNGEPVTRYFVNVASFGLSGAIVDKVNHARIARLFGGAFAFGIHRALSVLTYRERMVRIRVDGDYDEIASIAAVAVANGQYFGGGMRVAPNARPDDGLFDVIIIGGGCMSDLKLLSRGEHLKSPGVRALHGCKIVAAPVAETRGHPIYIEVDGECTGRLPATFEILPHALNLRC